MDKLQGQILLVDDDEAILEIVSEQLKSFGLYVIRASNGSEALKLVKNNDFDLVITDLTMPKMSGGEFVSELNRSFPDLSIIVITGQTMIDDLSLFNGNVLHFLSKPFTLEDLYEAISESLSK